MKQARWLGMTAVLGLWLVAPFCQAAEPTGSVIRTHLKYANRASLAQPSLRSSAALVLDGDPRLGSVFAPFGCRHADRLDHQAR